MKVYSDFLLFSLWSVLFGYYCIIWASLYVGSSLSHYPKKRVSRSFLSRKRNTRKENEKVSVSYHRETILQKGNVIILTVKQYFKLKNHMAKREYRRSRLQCFLDKVQCKAPALYKTRKRNSVHYAPSNWVVIQNG